MLFRHQVSLGTLEMPGIRKVDAGVLFLFTGLSVVHRMAPHQVEAHEVCDYGCAPSYYQGQLVEGQVADEFVLGDCRAEDGQNMESTISPNSNLQHGRRISLQGVKAMTAKPLQ